MFDFSILRLQLKGIYSGSNEKVLCDTKWKGEGWKVFIKKRKQLN